MNSLRHTLPVLGIGAILGLSVGCMPPPPNPYAPKISSDANYASATHFFDNGDTDVQVLAPNVVADHPGLNSRGHNSMHGDAYVSGTHPYAGPVGTGAGTNLVVDSGDMSRFVGGQCGNTLFTDDGTLISFCADFFKSAVYAFRPDAQGFRKVAADYVLPNRESSATLDIAVIMNDTSGGAYFHIDNQNRMVLADADNNLRIFRLDPLPQPIPAAQVYTDQFVSVGNYDLDVGIPAVPDGKGGMEQPDITNIMPDWANDGLYWFVTREGHVGTVDISSGTVTASDVQVIALPGEEIQNAMAQDAEAVYVVSDYAMYRFERGVDSEPVQIWRQSYDRGTALKPGQINQGSGTTPTLMGSLDDLIGITDNADDYTNIVVYARNSSETDGSNPPLCTIGIFNDPQQANGDGTFRSASDNSLIGYHDSLIVENNYGYSVPTANNWTEPGLWRVDVQRDGGGNVTGCAYAWKNNVEASQTTVPKLSVSNGLIYIYTREPISTGAPDETSQAYYFGAINYSDGKMAFKVLTGTGQGYNNNYSPITIGPDGTAYVGTFAGIVSVKEN